MQIPPTVFIVALLVAPTSAIAGCLVGAWIARCFITGRPLAPALSLPGRGATKVEKKPEEPAPQRQPTLKV